MDKIKAKKKEDVMKKFDPALVRVAVMELASDMKKIDEKDVEEAKEQIRKIYKSIPKTKDGMEILTKALSEFNAEIVVEEIEKVKTELKDFSKTELMELNKDLVALAPSPCIFNSIICPNCIKYLICVKCMSLICALCMKHVICTQYTVCAKCMAHSICTLCMQYMVCTPSTICSGCVGFTVRVQCENDLAIDCGPGMRFPLIPELIELLINNPVLNDQLVETLLNNPKLSRAMRKFVLDMQKNGEI